MWLMVKGVYNNNKSNEVHLSINYHLTEDDISAIFKVIKSKILTQELFSKYNSLRLIFVDETDTTKSMEYIFISHSTEYKVVMSLFGKYLRKLSSLVNNGTILTSNIKGDFNYEEGSEWKNSNNAWGRDSIHSRCGCESGVCGQRSKKDSGKEGKRGEVDRFREVSSGSINLSEKDRKKDDSQSLLCYSRPIISDATTFRERISYFKGLDKNAASVDVHSLEEYKNMTCYLYDNGNAGVAVEKSGNIVSVFKVPHTGAHGFGKKAVQDAIALGATKLDCYSKDSVLPNLYMTAGMKPVCKIKFNRKFAPEDWNYDEDGEPDIVFMMADKNIHDSYSDYTDEEVPYFDDKDGVCAYDRAAAYRDSLIKKKQKEIPVEQEQKTAIELATDVGGKLTGLVDKLNPKNLFKKRE